MLHYLHLSCTDTCFKYAQSKSFALLFFFKCLKFQQFSSVQLCLFGLFFFSS
uniref:Uncharacterized protein n=1 Tax=Anguilla anguilla TaxID=7936 RepID=A0A0E9QP02_ANGAN